MTTTPRKPVPAKDRPRAARGRYVASPDTAQRDATAAHLRHDQGLTYQQIADQLGMSSVSSAHDAVQRALTALRTDGVADLKKAEDEHLLRLRERAWRIMEADAPLVADGRVVKDPEGVPYVDLDKTLRAIATLLKLSERRARLHGLDAPRQHKVSVDESAIDREIRELAERLAAGTPRLSMPDPS